MAIVVTRMRNCRREKSKGDYSKSLRDDPCVTVVARLHSIIFGRQPFLRGALTAPTVKQAISSARANVPRAFEHSLVLFENGLVDLVGQFVIFLR